MKEMNLYIFPEKTPQGAITYTMARNRTRPAPGNPLPQVHLPKNSQRWQLNFEIINAENTDVKFKDPPFVIGEDCPCPPPPGSSSEQIVSMHRHNGTQAYFVDRNNGEARRIVYEVQLEENGRDWPFDPEVQNGGGTGNLYSYVLLGSGIGAVAGLFGSQAFDDAMRPTYVIAGALVGALIGFLAGKR